MNITEIIESIKNTGKIFDVLRGNQTLAREIRQTYNKVIRGKVKGTDEKISIKFWAEYAKHINDVQQNPQLVQMLDEIIMRCAK